MDGQTPVNTQSGEILKMEKPPNKVAAFRHALRLFPFVFNDLNDGTQYVYGDAVEEVNSSLQLYICRTIISASTVLSSPSEKSIDQNTLIRLERLLETGKLSNESRSAPGLCTVHANSGPETLPYPAWNYGSTHRILLGLELNALISAIRALAVSLNCDIDDALMSLSEQGMESYGHIISKWKKEQSTDQSDLQNQPLWPSGHKIEDYVNVLLTPSPESASLEKEDMWSFWREWYGALLVGKPFDWTLQSRIAFIPDDIWDSGVGKVSQEIERIKAKLLSEKLPQAETVELNPESESFFVSPVPMNNVPLLSALLTNISDAMKDALQGNNGLSERSSEHRKIRRAVTRYGNNPQQAELTLTTVAKGLRRQLYETNDLPDSEDNLALLEAVKDGVRGIRANHPEVAVNREQLDRQTLKELGEDDRRLLEQAQPVLIALSEGDLARDFAEDIPSLINDSLLPVPDGGPTLPGADAATRVFSRVSKMALIIEKAAEWHDSKPAKAVRLGFQGVSVLGVLYAVVMLGLTLLGVFS